MQDFSCHITGVYAPNCYVERLVWEEIVSIRGLIEGPWQFVVILTRLDMYQKRGEEMYHENNRVAGVL